MHVLIVSQYFSPENFRINDLALSLRKRGHEVSVLTGMPNYPGGKIFDGYSWLNNKKEMFHGISIYRVPLFLRRKSKAWQLVLNYLSFVLSSCALGPFFLRGKKIDVVYVYALSPFTVGITGALFRRLKNAPMVLWVQDLWPESLQSTGAVESERVLNIVRYMVQWIYKHCDFVLVQSKAFIEPVVSAGAERDRVHYFPNWAENLYKPVLPLEDSPERREVPDKGFIVMFAGNLGVAQSLETIIGAAKKLKAQPINWIILGDGRRRDWLEEQVQKWELAGSVHLLGGRHVETMPAYFSLADAMLVTLRPDPTFAATIPGKVQSYLACGRPIVGALDGEGAKVIRESGAGFAVAAGDADGLADSVLKMSKMSSDKKKEMGDNGMAYYMKNFNGEKLIDQLEEWLNKWIKRHNENTGARWR